MCRWWPLDQHHNQVLASAPHPPYSIYLWSRAVGLLSLRVCQEMSRRPLIRGRRSASCSSRRCCRGYWKVILQAVFLEWMEQLRKCIATNGEYTE
jgi:hypothetical protein